MDSVDSDNQLNPKIGMVFKPFKNFSVRSSLSRGFRAPSLAVVFTSTVAGGFRVISNTDLLPEKSTYFELGLNHLFQNRLVFDAAYFHTRLSDLIEADFLPSGDVQFQNITSATVNGLEGTVSGQFIPRYLGISVNYTYVNATDDNTGEFLQFRPRHLFYLSTRSEFNHFEFLVDYRFIKRYDRIDDNFAAIIEDGDERVDAHVVDLRLTYPFTAGKIPFRLTFQISNALRYYYTDLIVSLAPLRRTSLTLETGF
jgi:outer membrane receptor protein involved in Fe transport